MTPGERAKDLIEKFMPYVWSGASFIGIEEVEMMRDNPKECAIVCVNEIMEFMSEEAAISYWNKVKEEISKSK